MQLSTLPKIDITDTLRITTKHPLLARLVKEISDDKARSAHLKYDRTHNKHNRGR